jgi:succinyl-CoA synthetase beta subunit
VKIHEYQAKELMKKYGIPVPNGKVVTHHDKAQAVAKELGSKVIVVKAQIHAGGRGKGRFKENPDLGGVKLAKSPKEAEDYTKGMLGNTLVTHQTGGDGKTVHKVLVEEGLGIKKEYYLGMVVDREASKVVIMASTEGGMEIEKVAAETPEKIIKVWVDPGTGLMPFHMNKISFGLGLPKAAVKSNRKFIYGLYNLFTKEDASLAEINPLIMTEDEQIMALDAKINFDDNSSYRHKDLQDLRDFTEEDPLEVEAGKYGFNYVKLHGGSVGCMVNGAGLAMATMDIIKLNGADPANFLDVGGAANPETVENAFKVLINDKDVKAVLINIFGGIVRCDVVATGIVEGLQKIGQVDVPVVVRLRGTNAEEGLKILKESDLEFTLATEFAEAAEKAVKLAKGGG